MSIAAGGLLLALRVRETATRTAAVGSAFLLAFAPWFGLPFTAAAVPLLLFLIRSTYKQKRPLLGLIEIEVGAASGVALASVEPPRGTPATPGDGPQRLLALLIDDGVGVLRWAPVLLLACAGAYLLYRSRREKLARAIPARREAEVAAVLAGVVTLAVAGAAAFGTVAPAAGLPCAAALCAWGLRRVPRTGAVLGLVTLAGTAWVAVELATDRTALWLSPAVDAPWGPLAGLFPAF